MAEAETIEVFLEEYLDYCRVECTPQTIKQYELILRRFVRELGGQTRLMSEITPRELQRYQAHNWGKLKRATVSGYTAIIKSFFAWAVRKRYIDHSPAHELRRPSTSTDGAESRAIPPEHLRQILEYARITSKRNHAMLMFLIATGCRVGGLLSLQLHDLDLPNYRASIRLKGGKTSKVFFGDVTREALERYLVWRPECDHNHLWVWEKKPYSKLGHNGVYAMIVDICRRVDLPKEYFIHGTRHSVGISWTKAGVALGIVSTKLNHSDIRVTHQHYAQPDDEFISLLSRRYEMLPLEDHPQDTGANKNIIRAG